MSFSDVGHNYILALRRIDAWYHPQLLTPDGLYTIDPLSLRMRIAHRASQGGRPGWGRSGPAWCSSLQSARRNSPPPGVTWLSWMVRPCNFLVWFGLRQIFTLFSPNLEFRFCSFFPPCFAQTSGMLATWPFLFWWNNRHCKLWRFFWEILVPHQKSFTRRRMFGFALSNDWCAQIFAPVNVRFYF